MSMQWTSDSDVVTADSPVYTASGSGGGTPLPPSTQFPNVPALPGVPQLARLATAAVVAAGATISGETQALAAALGLPITVTFGTNALYSGLGLQPLSQQSQPSPPSDSMQPVSHSSKLLAGALPPYGITAAGSNSPIISPDSAVEFDFDAGSDINSHPVELGGFSGYNRVQQSKKIGLLLACQGKNMSRSSFLSALERLKEGTQVVTVSTPDASYPNMALKQYGYKKTSDRGAVTIWADTRWEEERSTNVVVTTPPTAQPQGAATSNLGALQAVQVTAQQMAAVNSPTITPLPLPPIYSSTAPPSGAAW